MDCFDQNGNAFGPILPRSDQSVFFSIYMCLYVYICICLCVTYRVVLCRTVSYCVVLCRTVSYCVVLCRTVSYCVVRCRCCTTPCMTLYDASYIPDASGPDALYDTVRRVVRSRRVGPRHLVRRPDASYSAFPTALPGWPQGVYRCVSAAMAAIATSDGRDVATGNHKAEVIHDNDKLQDCVYMQFDKF